MSTKKKQSVSTKKKFFPGHLAREGRTADHSPTPRSPAQSNCTTEQPSLGSALYQPTAQSLSVPVRLQGVEALRRMHGGAQAQLIRCSDGGFYVVKFQNNPQGVRILANEMLGALLARGIGLPVPEPAIVEVHRSLIAHTDHLTIQLVHSTVPCLAGLCFGSRYPSSDEKSPGTFGLATVLDFLPQEQLSRVENLSDFDGMLVFDKWTGNVDQRQAIFVRQLRDSPYYGYRALMIDQGFCFDGTEWDFPDGGKRGLYAKRRVYEKVAGLAAFEPWLNRLERSMHRNVLEQAAQKIPPEWYDHDSRALARLIDALDERRTCARGLLVSTRKSVEHFFPAWLGSFARREG